MQEEKRKTINRTITTKRQKQQKEERLVYHRGQMSSIIIEFSQQGKPVFYKSLHAIC